MATDVAPRRMTVDRASERQRLEVHRDDGTTVYSDKREIIVAVGGNRAGIRVHLRLGVDGQTVYLEAYHWLGFRQPIRIVSTVTGETIDTHQLPERPHPELAIIETNDG